MPARRRHRHTVVVGFDGSAAADAALDVAVDRARRRRGDLIIVHAGGDRSVLDGVLLTGHDRLADVEWTGLAVQGPAPRAILDAAAAREADEIVVGTRGLGRARALLGSTSHEVLRHARCPVTVVRAPDEPHVT